MSNCNNCGAALGSTPSCVYCGTGFLNKVKRVLLEELPNYLLPPKATAKQALEVAEHAKKQEAIRVHNQVDDQLISSTIEVIDEMIKSSAECGKLHFECYIANLRDTITMHDREGFQKEGASHNGIPYDTRILNPFLWPILIEHYKSVGYKVGFRDHHEGKLSPEPHCYKHTGKGVPAFVRIKISWDK